MKLLITTFFILILSQIDAQLISGRITDENNQPIAMAIVKVDNSTLGVKSDNQGYYKLELAKAGTYTIQVSYIGYAKESFTITIAENQKLERNIVLNPSNRKVKEVKVKGAKSKATETAALAEQKSSTAAVEIMGSQEMSRKGASDAQGAVVKMAGITKEEGSSQIYVRGLGDRYNSTMLNGMFLPSDNPEYKNISLEYFPIDIIQNIGVNKTYNNNLLGDFGGATINITTKDFSGKPFLSASVKTGFNTQAIGNKNLGSGVSYLGSVDYTEIPTTVNGQFIERQWMPEERSAPKLNSEISLNGGWSANLSEKVRLSLFGTGTISNKFIYFKGMSQVLDAQGGLRGDSTSKESYTYSVNKNAMINAVLAVGEKYKTKLNYLVFNTVGNQWNDYTGLDGSSGLAIWKRRNVKDISILNIIQWINEYKYNDRLSLALNFSWSDIINNQPDRLTQSYNFFNNVWQINTNQEGENASYYQKLHDNDYSANLLGRYILNENKESKTPITTLQAGYTLRYKTRAFSQYEYIFKSIVPNPSGYELPSMMDDYFNESNLNKEYVIKGYRTSFGTILPNTYDGELLIHSPNVNIEHSFSDKLNVNLGARFDIINQEVRWDVINTEPLVKGAVSFSDFKVLPFLNARYKLTENQNLKFAFSKTYTLPQFKELAPFLYNDISTFNTRGNPYLYSSDNYNVDLKWESFPTKNELFSGALFGKWIQNPINKIFEAATGQSQMTYANSGNNAILFGAEVEIKKNIIDRMNADSTSLKYQLTGGFNISALYSQQDLDSAKIRNETYNRGSSYTSPIFTFKEATLQGASPLIFNFDLTYRMKLKNYEPMITLTLNYFHDRLYAIGSLSARNTYEKGYFTLDLITRHSISKKWSASFNVKNILNPSIDRYQEFATGDRTINSFKKGVEINAGLNYTF